MDAASPGDAAGGMADEPGASSPPSRFQWLWAPLALGAAAAIVNLSLSPLVQSLWFSLILGNQYVYTHQSQLNFVPSAVGDLVVPVMLVAVASAFALRAAHDARRRLVAPRLLSVMALLLGVAALRQVASVAIYRSLTGGQSSPSAINWAGDAVAALSSGVNGLLLGVAIIVALRAVAPDLAPHSLPQRQGYSALAGAVAGSAMVFFSLIDRFTLLTVTAIRLASVGATGCVASSGAGCYSGQMLDLVRFSVLPLLVGAAVGGVLGNVLAPERAGHRVQDVRAASPAEPAEAPPGTPTGSRPQIVEALRYLAGGVIGALYIALALALTIFISIYSVNHHAISMPPGRFDDWSAALTGLSLLIPAGWLALVGARGRIASALSQGGKRALRRALAPLAVSLGLLLSAIAAYFQVAISGYGLPVILLVAFSLGAAYGLLWSPQPRAAWRAGVRAAATGWLGASFLVAILLALAFNSLIIAGPPANSCHGLACGALYFLVVDTVIGVGVHIIVFGLPAALFAGGLAGMAREALRAS